MAWRPRKRRWRPKLRARRRKPLIGGPGGKILPSPGTAAACASIDSDDVFDAKIVRPTLAVMVAAETDPLAGAEMIHALLPVYMVLVTSFKSIDQVSVGTMWQFPTSFTLESFQRALSADPNLVDAMISLGDLYKAQGLTSRAQSCYEDVIKIAPENQQAKSRLSAIKKR